MIESQKKKENKSISDHSVLFYKTTGASQGLSSVV